MESEHGTYRIAKWFVVTISIGLYGLSFFLPSHSSLSLVVDIGPDSTTMQERQFPGYTTFIATLRLGRTRFFWITLLSCSANLAFWVSLFLLVKRRLTGAARSGLFALMLGLTIGGLAMLAVRFPKTITDAIIFGSFQLRAGFVVWLSSMVVVAVGSWFVQLLQDQIAVADARASFGQQAGDPSHQEPPPK